MPRGPNRAEPRLSDEPAAARLGAAGAPALLREAGPAARAAQSDGGDPARAGGSPCRPASLCPSSLRKASPRFLPASFASCAPSPDSEGPGCGDAVCRVCARARVAPTCCHREGAPAGFCVPRPINLGPTAPPPEPQFPRGSVRKAAPGPVGRNVAGRGVGSGGHSVRAWDPITLCADGSSGLSPGGQVGCVF